MRPARPRYQVYTRADGSQYTEGCCNGNAAVPRWTLFSAFPSTSLAIRQSLIDQHLATAAELEEPWCEECATVGEQIVTGVQQGGPLFLSLVATVASFVPGIGTGVAFALGAAAALARGENISDAMVDAMVAAIPAGAAISVAAAAGKSLLRGENISDAALAAGHELARVEAGDLGAAAFDAAVAVAVGKTLQDAGFAALHTFSRGNTIADRGLEYAQAITRAATAGRNVGDVLKQELISDVKKAAGAGAGALLRPIVQRIIDNPSLLDAGSDALAASLGVSEVIARAAQAVARDGSVDQDLYNKLTDTATKTAVDKYGAAFVASNELNTSFTQTEAQIREETLRLVASQPLSFVEEVLQPSIPGMYRSQYVPAAAPDAAPSVVAPLVQDAAPVAAPRTGVIGDVALGGVLAAAVVAVVWWAKGA